MTGRNYTCHRLLGALLLILLIPAACMNPNRDGNEHGCVDGQTRSCVLNGCTGVRECVNGRLLGCAVPDVCLAPPVRDQITVSPVVPGNEVGVLYDGADAQGPFSQRGLILTPAGTVALGLLPNVLAPGHGNSVIAFARSRQPARFPALWTPRADYAQVPVDNNIRFNITFWILAGDFATQQQRAAAAVLAVNNAYTVERAGLRIAWVDLKDATANPNAATLMAGGGQNQFQTLIGFDQGQINVYVTGTVLGSTTTGVNFDGTPVILLGRDVLTFPQSLEHELGHAFVLWHVGAPNYNWQNVMAPIVSAHFLTEGQTFRMHFHPSSQINVFGLRPGRPTFVCTEDATDDCPANSRRLWADGDMPAN